MTYSNRDDIIQITAEWTGERFADGRPRVGDDILARIRGVTTEEAWMPLHQRGYKYQYEGRFKTTHPGARLLGRAVTAVMVPSRPDVHMNLLEYGREKEGRHGFFNQWVIDAMSENDILVVDMCDKIVEGTFVGGNLSTAIKARAKHSGAVIWGGIRDLEQIVTMEDFQVYYRGVDPAPINGVMMTGMNVPCRVGDAVCLPGDVVLGTISGVVFIPAHLAETVAIAGEKTQVKDIFGFERLREKKYTSAQVDAAIWSREVMDDFMGWFAASPLAQPFQHLTWDEEIEKSRTVDTWDFTGLA